VYQSPNPIYADRGEGCRLIDVDGNEYIDFVNNHTSLIHGHCHPAIVEAVSRQLSRGTAWTAYNEHAIRLATMICDRVESVDSLRFCNSGTEATMMALRAARAYTGKSKMIKSEGGYHGSHDHVEISIIPIVAELGPESEPRSVPEGGGAIAAGALSDVICMAYNNAKLAEPIIRKHADDIAAIIIEPVMGAIGVIPGEKAYLQMLRDVCSELGIVLIFDEVQVFRLGYGGAQGIYGIQPDLTCFGKIIGGGFPVGAFGGRREIMEVFAPTRPGSIMHGGTFNGNPISMVAGVTALDLLPAGEIERINGLGESLRAGFRRTLAEVGIKGHVTGLGSMSNLHITAAPAVTGPRDVMANNSMVMHALNLALLNAGIMSIGRGLYNISTPMTRVEVDACVTALQEALVALRSWIADSAPELMA
jgi:glutamate-1-semialdehyde 2,1-aminomutase